MGPDLRKGGRTGLDGINSWKVKYSILAKCYGLKLQAEKKQLIW